MSIPTHTSPVVSRSNSRASLPSPSETPLPSSQPTQLTRSGSTHSDKAQGAGLPKGRSRTGSQASQVSVQSVRRPSSSEATSKLAALDKQKGVDRTPEAPAILHGGRSHSDDITPTDVERARGEMMSHLDLEGLAKQYEQVKGAGLSDQDIAGHALANLFDEPPAARHSPSNMTPAASDSGDAQRGNMLQRAASTTKQFAQRVAANKDFTSSWGKILASGANVTVRNFPGVFVGTFARQFITMGQEAAFAKYGTSPQARAALGTLFGVGPALVAHGAGAIRDEMAGTATWTSRRSRMIMAGTAVAATAFELGMGAADENSSLHIGFTAYTAIRDLLVQSNLRLDNHNTDGLVPDWKHFGAMMVAYGIDQGVVSYCMSKFASPSGPGAFKAHAGVKEQLTNAGVRAFINLLGEIGEDLMFQSIPAVRAWWNNADDAHVLQLGIHSEGYQAGYLANAAMGPWAVRTGILATTIALTGVTGKKVPEKFQELTADMIIGGVNALLYEPFANAGSGQPDPKGRARIEDAEAADAHGAESDADSVRTYPHPNADMTNLAAVKRQQDMQLTQRRPGPNDASTSTA